MGFPKSHAQRQGAIVKDTRTPGQRRDELIAFRERVQLNVAELVGALHDAGFSSLLVESVQVGDDSHFNQRVIVDNDELGPDRMRAVLEIADAHLASVSLMEIRMNQQSFSRIALWAVH
jgi:hypothetical protein